MDRHHVVSCSRIKKNWVDIDKSEVLIQTAIKKLTSEKDVSNVSP